VQKRSLIPTSLVDRAARPVEIVEASPPGLFAAIRIVRLVAVMTWAWWRTSLSLVFQGDARTRDRVQPIRELLERMGGLWIKAGQLVAMRRDVFLPETCDELSKLQDQALGFGFEHVRRILEAELGAKLESVYSEFSERPIAAASIGQTHEARLRHNGRRVAVKVQRPYVGQTVARDIRSLKFVAFWLKWFGVAPHARWDEMIWELESALNEELDYRIEASAIVRMRKSLAAHKVYAPKVFLRYSARRVLTMEFLEGVFMRDFIAVSQRAPEHLAAWLVENNVNPRKVGERLILSHLRQMLEDNLYHADLHPGNILIQRNSRLALIDFGTIGSCDKSLLHKNKLMFEALADGDFQKMADMFLLMAPPLPNRDLSEAKAEIVKALRVWETRTTIKHLPYHEKSITSLFGVFARLLRICGVPSNWEFLRLNRADLTMDASIMFLCPNINYPQLLRKYGDQARERAALAATQPKAIRETVDHLLQLAKLPSMLAENLYFQAEYQRKRALGFEGRIGKVAYLAKSALSLFAFASVGASLFFLAHTLRMRFPAHFRFLDAPWVEAIFALLPRVRTEVWLGVAIAAFYVSRKVIHMRRFVEEKDYSR
jgi:ubiquinone biosynthesis protein